MNKLLYHPEIDGLRAFAVLSVVAFHTFPDFIKGGGWGGFIGVDVFFVISGFLITSNIFKSLDKEHFRFADFYARRIRRIFPALIIVIASSLIFGWFVLLNVEYIQLGKHAEYSAAFIANFLFASEVGYFDNMAETKPLLHLWSLAVEEQFYIVWPLILWLAWKRRLNLIIITVVVALMSFYLNLHFVNSHPNETFFWPFGRLWEILSGSILAWILLYKKEFFNKFKFQADKYLVRIGILKTISADMSITSNMMSFFGFLLLSYSIICINEKVPFPSQWTLIPVLGALFIIASGSKVWLNRVFLMNPVAIWFGLISYPLYLWHWPILSFLQIIYGKLPNIEVRIAAILFSILLAWLTYYFIERPLRFRPINARTSFTLILMMILIGSIGLYLKKIEGYTPYNILQTHISEAVNDWDYPKGLKNGKVDGVYVTKKDSTQVIFIGDSHLAQYGPRIVDLYDKGLSKEVAFITMNGCPPIPNIFEDYNKGCFKLLNKLEKVLSLNQIETIIIGAGFNTYFGVGDDGYYFKEKNKKIPLSKGKGIELAKQSFYNFVSELAKIYNVVVLLDSPSDQKFDPKKMFTGNNRSIPLARKIHNDKFPQAEYQISVANEMRERLLEIDVNVVDQASLICPNNACSAVTNDGRPIYKDSGHMRPFFVKEKMNVLDPYFVLPSTGVYAQ